MTSVGYVIAGLLLCWSPSWALPANEDGRATSVEICQWKEFEPSCPPESVVLVVNASYGRRVSHLQRVWSPSSSDSSTPVETAAKRCIQSAYGEDCLANVKPYIASRCSGRRRCIINLPDAELNRSPHGCPLDLTANLEVSYRCLPVKSGSDEEAVTGIQRTGSTSCDPSSVVSDSRGYLASVSVEERGIGSELCPWTIQAQSGQTITLTVFDFAMPYNSSSVRQMADSPLCFASVRESTSSTWYPICRLEPLDRSVYVSNSNVVYVKMNIAQAGVNNDRVHVLVKFEATGCPDFATPLGSVVKRTGDTVIVRCAAPPKDSAAVTPAVDQLFRLSCVNGNWSTSPVSISCASSTTSPDGSTSGSWFELNSYVLSKHGFLVVVVLSIALFVSFVIVAVGMFCLCRPYRKKNRGSGNADLAYISGGSTDRCAKHDSVRSSFRAHGQHHLQPQQLDPRMHCDPTWKEMQPMLMASGGKYSSSPATPTVSDGRFESDYGGWGFGAGWPEHHQPLSASQQHHLERDYATTLQMRRTVLPSSVMPRHPNGDHSSTTCVCPLHGLHHPAVAASVSSTANPVSAHRAWTGDSGSGVSEVPRSPSAVEGGSGNARFSTFRPRTEHIYEVPRFVDGQDDANVADYDGVTQRVGYDDDNGNGYPTLPLYHLHEDPRTFGSFSIKLPYETNCCSSARK